MKITIECGDEPGGLVVYDDVTQFALCGVQVQQGVRVVNFRRSVSDVSDQNYLIGLVEALKEDMRDHKRASA